MFNFNAKILVKESWLLESSNFDLAKAVIFVSTRRKVRKFVDKVLIYM